LASDRVWKDAEVVYGCFPAFPSDVRYHPELGFAHLSTYGPRYIAYQQSLVISKDFQSVWEKSEPGLMDSATTRRYCKLVLERGSSVDASEMIRDFLGRSQSPQAYLKWLNSDV
jgi:thimet oligopeptidase